MENNKKTVYILLEHSSNSAGEDEIKDGHIQLFETRIEAEKSLMRDTWKLDDTLDKYWESEGWEAISRDLQDTFYKNKEGDWFQYQIREIELNG